MRKLFVVGFDFQIWTGSTVLRRENFRLEENGQLPPDDLVENLGCKKLIDTKQQKRARRCVDGKFCTASDITPACIWHSVSYRSASSLRIPASSRSTPNTREARMRRTTRSLGNGLSGARRHHEGVLEHRQKQSAPEGADREAQNSKVFGFKASALLRLTWLPPLLRQQCGRRR